MLSVLYVKVITVNVQSLLTWVGGYVWIVIHDTLK